MSTHCRPHQHGSAEHLGQGKASVELIDDGLADNDARPEKGGREGIVLADGADVLLPAHDGGRAERTLVQGLGNVGDAHGGEETAPGVRRDWKQSGRTGFYPYCQ